ncbi:hypothetical protein [Sorangium sp. So ce693]
MGVRRLAVLDDGPQLQALTVGKDARHLDVDGVAGEAAGRSEHPVGAEL